jgi:hypothetical protein
MIIGKEKVLDFIKSKQQTEQWVRDAREYSVMCKALVDGKNFKEVLIKKIEKLESENRAKARQKYSKDIRDLFYRVLEKRDNVFQANGGSEEIKIKSETQKEEFVRLIENFKGGKSLSKYLSEYFFRCLDTDPNGLLFLEYKTEDEKLKIYPTYKSINDIRSYEADGQKCAYVLFEPKKILAGSSMYYEWRLVDDEADYMIKQIGNRFVIDNEKTFKHNFKEVPAIIYSDYLELGNRRRLSFINPVIELAQDYARDKSVVSIYKFFKGFPIHWQYVTECKVCKGVAKTGDGKACSACNGSGILGRSDVTDQINITKPREGDPIITPNLAGFISPDLETWKQYNEDQKLFEQKIESTIWGTTEINQGNETATGRFIDVQPITNKLNTLSDKIEWVHNEICNWIANAVMPNKSKDEIVYHKSYGRRFIIESADVVLERYEKSREAGSPTSILDKLLQEVILSKYKNDPYMQELMVKKIAVEPYVHLSVEQVNTIFGQKEAFKKVIFEDFWQQADKTQEISNLVTNFKLYTNEQFSSSGLEASTAD